MERETIRTAEERRRDDALKCLKKAEAVEREENPDCNTAAIRLLANGKLSNEGMLLCVLRATRDLKNTALKAPHAKIDIKTLSDILFERVFRKSIFRFFNIREKQAYNLWHSEMRNNVVVILDKEYYGERSSPNKLDFSDKAEKVVNATLWHIFCLFTKELPQVQKSYAFVFEYCNFSFRSQENKQENFTAVSALRVLELLKETDEFHPITQAKIATELGVDRKTVKRTLDTMVSKIDGFSYEEGTGGIYYNIDEKRDFTAYEVRLLVDSVLSMSNRVIGSKKAKILIEKLKKLVNSREQSRISRISAVSDKDYGNGKNVRETVLHHTLASIDELALAIESKKKVKFTYYAYKYGTSVDIVPVNKYQVSPYRLVFVNGFYMVLCILDDGSVSSFRIDMMKDISMLENVPAVLPDFNNHPELEADIYVEGHPYMQIGKIDWIEAKIDESEIGRAIDAFGKKINVHPSNRVGKLDISFKANTEDVFLWALQNTDVVSVTNPQELRNRLRKISYKMNEYYSSTNTDKAHLMHDYLTADKQSSRHLQYPGGTPSRLAVSTSEIELQKIIAKNGTEETIKKLNIDTMVPDLCQRFSKYTNLSALSISNAKNVTDISFLEHFKDITELRISFPIHRRAITDSIQDFSPIAFCKDLEELRLFGCSISDSTVLSALTKLNCLELNHTKISNIDFLRDTPHIEYLWISWNEIEDFSAIYELKELVNLSIDYLTYAKLDIERLRENNPTMCVEVHGGYITSKVEPPPRGRNSNIDPTNKSIKGLRR